MPIWHHKAGHSLKVSAPRFQKYDAQFKSVFDAIKALMEPSGTEPKRIEGFKP